MSITLTFSGESRVEVEAKMAAFLYGETPDDEQTEAPAAEPPKARRGRKPKTETTQPAALAPEPGSPYEPLAEQDPLQRAIDAAPEPQPEPEPAVTLEDVQALVAQVLPKGEVWVLKLRDFLLSKDAKDENGAVKVKALKPEHLAEAKAFTEGLIAEIDAQSKGLL